MTEDVNIDLNPKEPAPLNNGRYIKAEALHTGGQANIYLGYDTDYGKNEAGTDYVRQVCIKVPLHLPTEPLYRASEIRKLRREAVLQAKVAYENPGRIQEVYGFVLEGDPPVPWIILKKNEGQSLNNRMTKGYGLPLGEIVDLTKQLAPVIDNMNASGLVHGDIKPSNILRQGEGKGVSHKITDFGASKGVIDENTVTAGTPRFMTPEYILEGDTEHLDARGFAVTLYELLTGEQYDIFLEGATSITKSAVFMEKAEAAGIDTQTVEQIFKKQFDKDKSTRYKNVTEFSKVLVDALTLPKNN